MASQVSAEHQISDETYGVLLRAANLTPVKDLQNAAALALRIYEATKDLKNNADALKRLSYDACALVYMIICENVKFKRDGVSDHPRIRNFIMGQGPRRMLALFGSSKSDVTKHHDELKKYFEIFGLKIGKVSELLGRYHERNDHLLAPLQQRPELEQQAASARHTSSTRGSEIVSHNGNRQASVESQPRPVEQGGHPAPDLSQQIGGIVQQRLAERLASLGITPPQLGNPSYQPTGRRQHQRQEHDDRHRSDRNYESQPSHHPAFNQNQTHPFEQPGVHQHHPSAFGSNAAPFPQAYPLGTAPSSQPYPSVPPHHSGASWTQYMGSPVTSNSGNTTNTTTTWPQNHNIHYNSPVTTNSGNTTTITTNGSYNRY
ncbi:hypothetical protein H0H92_003391 [Tricholoma furcatifolium]|nr:hypothetical protein H0H92_003391 [Tricholoma furcatifolium]